MGKTAATQSASNIKAEPQTLRLSWIQSVHCSLVVDPVTQPNYRTRTRTRTRVKTRTRAKTKTRTRANTIVR